MLLILHDCTKDKFLYSWMGNYQSQLVQLKKQLAELKEKYDLSAKQLLSVSQQMRSIKQQQSQIKTQLQAQYQQSQNQFSSSEQKISNFLFNWDKRPKNINQVRIKGRKITKGSPTSKQFQTYRVASLQSFPKQGVYRITFHVKRLMPNNKMPVSLGVTIEKKQGIPSCDVKSKFVGYSSWPSGKGRAMIALSYAWAENVSQDQMGVLVGEQLQMIVNMNVWEISFTRKANKQRPEIKITDIPLPSCFVGKPLYVAVQLSNLGDIVQVI